MKKRNLQGIGLGTGAGYGPAFLLPGGGTAVERLSARPETEIARLQAALIRAETVLDARIDGAAGEQREIFEMHRMLLADESFFAAAMDRIRTERVNAEWALAEARDALVREIAGLEDEYLAARASDITDVIGQVLMALSGASSEPEWPKEPYVLIAGDLLPSQTALLDPSLVRGIATAVGSRTSHAAILAKNFGIPTVVGAMGLLDAVRPGETVLVDGDAGEVTVSPDAAVLARADARIAARRSENERLTRYRERPTVLRDGRLLPLFGNIGSASEAAVLREHGAEGVGLFRTEVLYLQSEAAPSEETQFLAYREAAERMDGRPVIIRTLDAGGDKRIPYLHAPDEQNPFLGFRAIRLCLADEALFKTQLRAILRAGAHGDVRLMFPMIARVSELRAAKALVARCKAELAAEGLPFRADMPVGVMIEIPAAAVMSDALAREADFFSIGSNDLTQYTLAADRMNPAVSEIGDYCDPALLRLIRQTAKNAARAGIETGVCGEMAGDPLLAPLLVAMGITELSMSAPLIPSIRRLLTERDASGDARLVERVLAADSAAAVRALLQENG